MRIKWAFWIIVVFVTAVLSTVGFLFFREEAMPFWVMQCIALASLLFSVFIYKKLIRPYNLIRSGMQLLKEQDFSTLLRPVKNKEANEMIEVFNRMIIQLRSERLAVREKNQFLDLLIQASPQGIVVLDFDQCITDINPAGMRLLQIDRLEDMIGIELAKAPFELASSLSVMKVGDDQIIRGSGVSVFRCIRSSFVDQGFDHPFILIEELTNELLRIEKESYERIIRMMSHEVNNSVGAIGSTLHVVSDIFKDEGTGIQKEILSAVEASYERCGRLSQFISKLGNVVKIPEPVFSQISINELVRTVEALTRMECMKRNIRLEVSLTSSDRMICADGIQMEQVLVNIIKNAYESIGENGVIQVITGSSPLSIQIEDNGPGIQEETKQKLFTPFYTTKSSGQGIGLMFVRDVLINHHASFSLTTQEGWTRFEILFHSDFH